MINTDCIGKTATLEVRRITPPGAILNAEELGEVLLPQRYVSPELAEGAKVTVFLYLDAKNRIIASTLNPKIQRDEFAYLKCKEVSKHGAFMDWGLEAKDLFIPFKEQKVDLQEGLNYVVYCYYDVNTERLVGSTKINKFLDVIPHSFEPNQEVEVLISGVLEIGFTCIINNAYSGMIYHNEVYDYLRVGMKTKAYIQKIREDEKIDVSLHPLGVERFKSKEPSILEFLKDNGGKMFITDKSDPELIRTTFNMSKKAFKKALGGLYKDKLIVIFEDRIELSA